MHDWVALRAMTHDARLAIITTVGFIWETAVMATGRYETAQICMNGHMVVRGIEARPESKSNFCSDCGAKTITTCPNCNTNIRGYYNIPGVISTARVVIRAYCHECGSPYPWTKANFETARELISDLDDLSNEECEQLKSALEDLMQGGPKTEMAARRWKNLMPKIAKGGAESLHRIATNLFSEAAKKLLEI